MSLSPLELPRHILEEAHYLAGQTETLSREEFLEDETVKRAFVRRIEIISRSPS